MDNTVNYVKNNMSFGDLAWSMITNAMRGLFTIIPIIGAFLAVERLFPGFPVEVRIIVALFTAASACVLVYMIGDNVGFAYSSEWLHTRKIDAEWMIICAVISWVIAGVFLCVVIALFKAFGYIFEILLSVFPLAVAPMLAFGYMLRGRYGIREWFGLTIISGYVFAVGLKLAGIVLVLSVDVIGWPLTALGLVCEILISAFYLYIDLTEWVRDDVQRKMSDEVIRETRAELEMMSEIAKRMRP